MFSLYPTLMAYKLEKPQTQGNLQRTLVQKSTTYRLPKSAPPTPRVEEQTTSPTLKQDIIKTIMVALLLLGLIAFLWWKLH
ncbi:hypothetical protein C5B42_01570 [Candidatus Cerribacteria bacterium 'Amazon FNV 2010 28 9']|uniref:Uncharacterized protein n=1 Tax=Candidatus Cerribacteria bacterium 'Amazon FNV 2010 28 9' TaxID=2081795 RepID=A0A317JPM6_9BACT|nr:MAG: hypothetical protein C5B42_01570 [Candidatus Cerribacteria bacterium 'Amazon FNV 2010 28 9']